MTNFCEDLQKSEYILIRKQELKCLYAKIQECELRVQMYKHILKKHHIPDISDLKTHQSNFE